MWIKGVENYCVYHCGRPWIVQCLDRAAGEVWHKNVFYLFCVAIINFSGCWEPHFSSNMDTPAPGWTVRIISSALCVYMRHVGLFIRHLAWHLIRSEDLSLLNLPSKDKFYLSVTLSGIHISSCSMVSRLSYLKWTSLIFHHRGFPLERGLVFRPCNCVFLSLECRSDLLGDIAQTTGLLFLFPSDMCAAYL